jgi:hypothetical protein
VSMFSKGNETYRSDLVLGEKYRDKGTGLEGQLVVISFFEHACERGTLRYLDTNRQLQDASFDAPELVHVASEQAARTQKTGGPDRGGAARPGPAVR